MKFLMYSRCGEGAGVLLRIAQEGNDVGLFIHDKEYKSVYDGILPKVTPEWIDNDTVVIFDTTGFGKIADELRSKGIPVFGAGIFADHLEKDRDFGTDVMLECGVEVPNTFPFTDFGKAYEFLKGRKEKFVFKPSGDMPCKLTYVPKGEDDLIPYMQFVERKFSAQIKKFDLQEFKEGIAVSTEAWCGLRGFIGPFNHTLEVKRFMNDDLGPATGCAGNVVWIEETEENCLLCRELRKVEKLCIENGLVGQIDLNAVVDGDKVYGLEWTPRFGYDAIPALLELFDGEVGEIFSDVARGQFKGPLSLRNEFAGAIRITIPPYPAEPQHGDVEKLSPNIGVPIIIDELAEHIYLYEAMVEDEQLAHSSGTGVILCATDVGEDPVDCLSKCYNNLWDNVVVPDGQYRTDLCQVIQDQYDDLNLEIDNA